MRYKNSLKQLGLFSFFTLVIVITSCKKNTDGIGQNLLPGSDEVYVLSNDTTPLVVSTYAEDAAAFKTDRSQYDNILLGNYNDETFGLVACKAFIQLDKSLPPALPTFFVVDSVVLNLAYSGYSYGNSLPMSMKVQWLSHPLNLEQSYTASSTQSVLPENLIISGYETLRPPSNSDSIAQLASTDVRFLLKPEVGEHLLREAQLSTLGGGFFVDAFKGMAISTDSPDGKVIGINLENTNTKLTVYYREFDQVNQTLKDQQRYDFLISDNCEAFTQIIHKRENSELAELSISEPISGAESAYVQAGAGSYVEVDISELDWLNEHPDATINSATLILPFKTSDYYPVPNLTVWRKNSSGGFVQITSEIPAKTNLGYYSVNLTAFTQAWLEGELDYSTVYLRADFELLQSFDYSYVNRIGLNGPQHSSDKSQNMRLSVTYTID